MRTSCPECGWVRPLHPLVAMVSCPCGWSELDEEIAMLLLLPELKGLPSVSAATVAA